MEIKEIEDVLNELIKKAATAGGYVWIVDKRQNNFALRLSEPIKLQAYTPSNNESEE